MKLYKIPFLVLALLTIFLSACAGSTTAASSWPGLTADQETAYLAYNQHIYALNLTNGLEKWRFPAEAERNISFYATPSVTSDNQLIVGGYDNVLYSLNAANGVENWSFKGATNRYVGGALAVGESIFAPNSDENLYTLDLQGSLKWTYKTQGPQWAQPITDPNCSCLYVPSMGHKIYSLDATTGTLNWQTEDLGGSIVGTPAYNPAGVLYAGTFSSEMLAIDAENGKIIWRAPTHGWVWSGPAFFEDQLYFGDLAGTFYALDAASGREMWSFTPDGPLTDAPLITEETIYLSTEAGSLFAVTHEGTTRWSKSIGGKLYSSPVQAGDLILVASMGAENLLYAFDPEGSQQWTFNPE